MADQPNDAPRPEGPPARHRGAPRGSGRSACSPVAWWPPCWRSSSTARCSRTRAPVPARRPEPSPGPRLADARARPCPWRRTRRSSRRSSSSRPTSRRRPTAQGGLGSGVIIDDAGDILTSLHVVDEATDDPADVRRRHRSPAAIVGQPARERHRGPPGGHAARHRRPGDARQPGRASASAARRSSSATRSGCTAR